MDYSPNAASLFRDLGGLDDMIFRLKAEIGLPTYPSSPGEAAQAMQIISENPEAATGAAVDAPPAAPGGESTEAPQAMQVASNNAEAVPSSEEAAASAAASASATAASEGASPSEPPPVPYHRRVLLKSLLRAIALASYAPGTATRPDVSHTSLCHLA